MLLRRLKWIALPAQSPTVSLSVSAAAPARRRAASCRHPVLSAIQDVVAAQAVTHWYSQPRQAAMDSMDAAHVSPFQGSVSGGTPGPGFRFAPPGVTHGASSPSLPFNQCLCRVAHWAQLSTDAATIAVVSGHSLIFTAQSGNRRAWCCLRGDVPLRAASPQHGRRMCVLGGVCGVMSRRVLQARSTAGKQAPVHHVHFING